MTRVLLLGMGPLPRDDLEVVDFPRLRTWQLLRGLLEIGIEVALVACQPGAAREPERETSGGSWKKEQLEGRTLELLTVSSDDFDRPDLPARWLHESRSGVVVSAGPFAPARAAARIPPGTPVWIDLPGDMMAEAQLRAASSGDPSHLAHAHQVLRMALARGDAFSVVGERQKAALLGQLALAGRFTAATVGWEGVHVVPVGLEPAWSRWAEAAAPGPRHPARVIWPGAVNTWADIDTFFEACRLAMARRADLEVVVTGGPIAGHEERAWYRLRERVAASPERERWRLTGWIDPIAAVREVCEAGVGVSLDRPCLEATLGSRTRLLYGLALGLSWVTTAGCELADRLIALGLAKGVPAGEPEAVCEAILERVGEAATERAAPGVAVGLEVLVADPVRIIAETRARVQAEVREKLLHAAAGRATVAPLLRWLERPVCVPPGEELSGGLVREVDRLEKALAEIHHSPTWRLLGALHRRVRR